MVHSPNKPRFTFDVEVQAGQLVLDYVLLNTLEDRIYVYDRPFSTEEECVNVCLSANHKVTFLHGICPAPPSPPFPPYESALAHPGASRLEPGSELRHHVVLPLPLEERTAYFAAPSQEPPVPTEISQVRFVVEFLRKRGVRRVEERPLKGQYYVAGAVESLVAEMPLRQPAVLNARLDPRVRFQ